jgi:GNAT superfamily N-acetyltransferase
MWESFWFEKLISFTLNWKMKANIDQVNDGDYEQKRITRHKQVRSSKINDPAMLVLVQRKQKSPQQQQILKEDANRNTDDDSRINDNDDEEEEKVVGMVELSLQPPDFNRNPPAAPLPLEVKQALAKRTEIGSVQGWVTNLLIDPACRGWKYSKVLMAATEGIAKAWGCQYIFLHADADIRSGRVPQKLYESLGYEVVTGNARDDYSWAGSTGLDHLSAIRMVDGVALLCYSKRLIEEDPTTRTEVSPGTL